MGNKKKNDLYKNTAKVVFVLGFFIILGCVPLPKSLAAGSSISYGGKVTLVFPPSITCPAPSPVMIVKNLVKGGIPTVGLYVAATSKIYSRKVLFKVGGNLVGRYSPAPTILCNGFISFPVDFTGTSN
jgi:hypothetical protein